MGTKELSVRKAGEAAPAETDKAGSWMTPAVDIFESDEGLTLVADLPGVGKDGLSLGIDSGVLTVEGRPKRAEKSDVLWSEFGAAGYYRRFQLPDNLDLEKIEANLRNGVLTLQVPKAAAARPRKIEVTVH